MVEVLHARNEPIAGRDLAVPHAGDYVDVRAFHAGVGSLDVLRSLRSSRLRQRPLSLNLQVPASTHATGQTLDAYLECLAREIDLVGCHLARQQRLEQLHLSGASLAPAQLLTLMTPLRKRFNFFADEGAEYSIDVDVNHTRWATMGLLREQGFNHVRIADAQQRPIPVHSLIDAARTFGFRSVSVELAYGHAWQTRDSVMRTLAALVELQPDRLRVFDCANPPQRTAAHRLASAHSQQDKALVRALCVEHLLAAGYQHLGLGQFVRPDDDLAVAQEHGYLSRNCLGFTRHGYCDHVGLGLGAISQFDALYAQNTEVLGDYLAHLQQGQLATCRGWRIRPSP